MSKTIHFNTGRKYSAVGQRITATWHDDGVITFMDHDRMICGQLHEMATNVHLSNRIDDKIIEHTVMGEYDSNRYSNTIRAHTDGLMRGGCNVEYKGS